MDENEVKDATGIIGTTESSDSSASTEPEKPIVMELGYKIPKPDSADEEAELYSKLETLPHNLVNITGVSLLQTVNMKSSKAK